MNAAALGIALAVGALAAGAQSVSPTPPARPFGVHPGTAADAAEWRSVRGRVVRGGAATARPLAGAWVVLHRVGTDRAGPLDSVRTDAAGAYAFRYRTSGDAQALYFASSTYGGIAYFTSPLREPVVTGDEAELIAFDTTSAPVSIRVRAHHVVFSAPDSFRTRTIVEVFELSNDSTVTRVARGDTGAVWEHVLLDGATDARIGQADFSPDALRFAEGRARLFAPFSPGLKQLSFSYSVPASEREFSVFVGAPTDVMEVLIEDPLGRAEGGGLAARGPTTVNGRTYARFLGQDARADAVVLVSAPSQGIASDNQVRVLIIIAALATALLVGLARAMLRRPPGTAPPVGAVDVASLRAKLAALDASFSEIEHPTADDRADHWQQRAHLTQQLTNALAREQGLT